MSNELIIMLIYGLVLLFAFVVLIAYIDDKISEIRQDIVISKIRENNKKDDNIPCGFKRGSKLDNGK